MTQIAIGEAFNSAIQTMEEYISEIQAEVNNVFNEFHQVAVVDNPWEVLYNTAASLEQTYNEQVLQAVKNQINNWAEGEGSYVSFTVRFKMGDEAKAEAERQQCEIVDVINNVPESTVISETKPNFLNTNFVLEDVKTKLEEISTLAKKLNDIVESKDSQLNSLSEENESVKTITNVGIIYGTSIASFVSKVTEKISEFLSEQIDSMEQQNETAVEEVKQSVERFNQSIDDTINDINSFLEDLFG